MVSYTAIVQFGKEDNTVPIYSSNITILILTLFIMVSLVITLVHWSSLKLDRESWWAMMVLYFIFVIQSVLLEYNGGNLSNDMPIIVLIGNYIYIVDDHIFHICDSKFTR